MSCEFDGSSNQHSTKHNKSKCHLRRSNAIRIRSRKSRILFQNSNSSKVQQEAKNENEVHLTVLDQIKRGVRLHSIRERSSFELSRKSSQEMRRTSLSSDRDDENLSTILAKVLEKRNLVMQQTDDESELSSIDSRPEEQYELLEESFNGEEIVSRNSGIDSNCTENISNHLYNNIDCFGGRIDLIMRL